MKVYVDELPKNCAECKFCGRLKPPAERPEIECMHCNMAKKFNSISPFCPLETLADHDKNDKYIQCGARLVVGKIYKCVVNNKPSLNKKMFTQMIKCLHDMSAKELDQFLSGETIISQTPQGDIIFKFKRRPHEKTQICKT